MSLLSLAAVFLGAAVIAVPLSRRLGLGSVLGYLVAGSAIGPWGLHLVEDVEGILHFAELGVVLLLFVIGLELQPKRLWTMRRPVFLLGGVQVAGTALVISLIALSFGVPWQTALVAGLGLSLSSTAFALQLLAEKGQLVTHHGRTAFAILLFQDLVAIPIVALLPLLGMSGDTVGGAADVVLPIIKVAAIVAAVIGFGRLALRHVLRLVARSGIREVFTASALLAVIGTSLIMEAAGLSMALGAFVAGVLLADSEFRHALEADIEPFKGLLLGLFFMAVGMSVNFGLLLTQPGLVLALVAGLTALKFAILYGLGALSGHSRRSSFGLAIFLSQGGEFAFGIFTIAVGGNVMAKELADLLVLVVSFSMAITPVLLLVAARLQSGQSPESSGRPFDVKIEEESRVIIAGFGRYGQIVGRILRARRIPYTALEISSQQVDFVAKYGSKIYYGDASRIDLLRAAHADKAALFVLAIDDVEASIRTARMVKENFPHLRILARARNRQHAYQLMDIGVSLIWRETLMSSLDTARSVLAHLGLSATEAERTVQTFKQRDEEGLRDQHKIYRDDDRMAAAAKQWAKELEQIFEQDEGAGGLPPPLRLASRPTLRLSMPAGAQGRKRNGLLAGQNGTEFLVVGRPGKKGCRALEWRAQLPSRQQHESHEEGR